MNTGPSADATPADRLQFASDFYKRASQTGTFGDSGRPADRKPVPPTQTWVRTLLHNCPFTLLILQLAWSCLVRVLTKWLPTNANGPGSVPGISIPTSVIFTAGFSLFILLAFFVREATARQRQALESLYAIGHILRHVVRKIRLDYPRGTWHEGDHDRLIAHLAAYPIALRMTLRNERDIAHLSPLLHPDDIRDILASAAPHLHCAKVVRAYIASAEDDSPRNFPYVHADETPPGRGTRFHLITLVDTLDRTAAVATRIAQFLPAAGYVSHLRAFVYIWALVLPPALVADSGWATLLWAGLITYPVAALFVVSERVSSPFSCTASGIPLTHICVEATVAVLADAGQEGVSYTAIVHEQPVSEKPTDWLSSALPPSPRGYTTRTPRSTKSSRFLQPVLYQLLVLFIWFCGVIFTTYGLSQRLETPRRDGDRWWSAQVPLSSAATSYVSAALFLVLTFWTTDAYARYTRALRLWTDSVRPNIDLAANVIAQMIPSGFWHTRDHDRIFAHLAALPVCMRLHLRHTRDVTDLRNLLSATDVDAFMADERPFPIHCMDVLLAYVDSADAVDKTVLPDGRVHPFLTTAFTAQTTLWEADRSLWECVAIRAAPLAPEITVHLRVFTALWLLLLPITLVQTDGFLSFAYLVPIAFSTLMLVHVGEHLSDPFGCGMDDVPIQLFCKEIRNSVHRIFRETRAGTRGKVHTREKYDRRIFEPKVARMHMGHMSQESHMMMSPRVRKLLQKLPKPSAIAARWRNLFGMRDVTPLVPSDLPTVANRKVVPTLGGLIASRLSRFPTVSLYAYVAVTLWGTLSVVLSWALAETWAGEDHGECRAWCSPIDVQGSVLSNVGFALFLILTLRTADSVSRFDEGARILYDLQLQMRSLALEFAFTFPTGFFHEGDKERVVAHLVQIPLCLRDLFISDGTGRASASKGLLTDADRRRFEQAASPMEHLIESVESYIFAQDSGSREGWEELDDFRSPPGTGGPQVGRLIAIRALVARATTIKRFPVVSSFQLQETLFLIIWLVMLPLSLTSDTGFYTILWSSIISYAVLALRDIAAQLSDPFGCDIDDLPVTQLCRNAADSVLEAMSSAGWDTDYITDFTERTSMGPKGKALGVSLAGEGVVAKFALPQLRSNGDMTDESWNTFDAHAQRRTQQSLLTHLLYSGPWKEVFLVFLWAVAASTISAWSRTNDSGDTAAWWTSTIAITTDVIDGASFGAFTLLGFFTGAAFVRHQQGGILWEERVRRSCHALAAALVIFYRDDAVHKGDKERVLGLVAAMPTLMKAELSNSRDIRDVSALINWQDLATTARADSMVLHCFDIIRAYIIRIVVSQDKLREFDVANPPRGRTAFTRNPLNDIEAAFQEARFLKTFRVSPIVELLLKTLLTLWFLLLPFVLFEISAWLTLLWTPVVAYGIIGTYAVAVELQDPFGTDLNDIDTDDLSFNIIRDVLHIQRHQVPAHSLVEVHDATPKAWSDELTKGPDTEARTPEITKPSTWSEIKSAIRLVLIAVPAWQLGLLGLWSGVTLAIGFGIKERFQNPMCTARWFCSFIAINEDIKEYLGFALFMLLGFRISDSHARFVQAQRVWHEGITGNVALLSNRMVQSFAPGSFHEGDVARICGHIAAVPIVLAGQLRSHGGTNVGTKLREVLGERDVKAILSAVEPVSRCIDVVRNYFFYSERVEATEPEKNGIPGEEYFNSLLLMQNLHDAAFEALRMARLALPFGYQTHLKIFLGLWLFILPVGLVEVTGWLMVLWTLIIGYGVLGIQRWADELVDPFGCDESDLPLTAFVDGAVDAVRTNMRLFGNGAHSMLQEGSRAAFPDLQVTVQNN